MTREQIIPVSDPTNVCDNVTYELFIPDMNNITASGMPNMIPANDSVVSFNQTNSSLIMVNTSQAPAMQLFALIASS